MQPTGVGHAVEVQILAVTGPDRFFGPALDDALDVEAPTRLSGREAERLERDFEFRTPAGRRPCRLHVPDAVPIPIVHLAVVTDEFVHPRADRVGLELERVAPVRKRVEQQRDAVVRVQHGVAVEARRDDRVGVGVVTGHADVQRGGRVQDTDLRGLRGGCALVGLALPEIVGDRRGLPRRLVQSAVQDDRLPEGNRPQRRPPGRDAQPLQLDRPLRRHLARLRVPGLRKRRRRRGQDR